MLTLLLIIKMVAFGWFISTFEITPTIRAIKKDKLSILDIPGNILSCIKCTTFWLTIVWTGSFEIAVYASLVAYLVDLHIFKDIEL